MKTLITVLAGLGLCIALHGGYATAQERAIVTSSVDSSQSDNVILKQEMIVDATLPAVWAAYTTEVGWKNWAAPLVEIDFRIGGTILSNYNADASIGDPGTNTLRIVNYVHHSLITLQADISANWPEFMKADAERMYNVILFKELPGNGCKIVSYGIGYRNNDKYRSLLGFFIQANEKVMKKLKRYLEEGPAPE